MLEVLSTGSTELTQTLPENRILLNCWGKSPLIKELERTVNFAERKCGDLMQQLNYYKEYYEKWSQNESNVSCHHKKKLKKYLQQTSKQESSSENEFEKVNQYFYRRIKNKITEINNEITEANKKLWKRNEAHLDPSKNISDLATKSSETISEMIENKISKSEPFIKAKEKTFCNEEQKSDVKILEKRSTKSIPLRKKKKEQGSYKRRYSSLQRFKIRSKSLPQGVRRKFGFGGFIEVFEPEIKRPESRTKSKISLKTEHFKARKSEGKINTNVAESTSGVTFRFKKNEPRTSKSLHWNRNTFKPQELKSTSQCATNVDVEKTLPVEIPTENNTPEEKTPLPKQPEDKNTCQEVCLKETLPSEKITNSKSDISFQQNLTQLITKPTTLVPFLRNPIPFIPCSSTSKTFNLGLNVQQVLSLIKSKRHSVTLQTIVKKGLQAANTMQDKSEQTINTLFITQTTTSHNTSVCPAREGSEDTFSIITDTVGCRSKCSILRQMKAIEDKKSKNCECEEGKIEEIAENSYKIERPEDVWVVEQPDSSSRGLRKVQSRCTCFPSKHCVDYHKVLRQYTGWRFPSTKSEGFTSETVSIYNHPISNDGKSKLCAIPSAEHMQFSDGRIELMKVHNDLMLLNRKYSELQEQISQHNLDDSEANAELDALESEVSVREIELKDILNFYKQLLMLKEKLKTLRPKSGQQNMITTSQKPKKDPFRPTPSMALTKVLRKIQGLQDKIKLIDAI